MFVGDVLGSAEKLYFIFSAIPLPTVNPLFNLHEQAMLFGIKPIYLGE